MATKLGVFTGNFTDASWLTVDATSLLDSEAANQALTTSYQLSSTFTPGGITVDGIAIKIGTRATGSPSNTITVALDSIGSTVSGTETTINVSDINAATASGTSPAISTNEGGWVYFRFNVAGTPTPVALTPAIPYSVKVKLSSTSTSVTLFRDGTNLNWSRMLATTTAAAPASTDILHVMGDGLAAGTVNSYTITMNNTASTTFGAVANTLGAFTVSKRGTVTWAASASTNYLLTIAGPLIVFSGGTWNQGTSGTPMPSTSTAKLLFAVSSNVDSGFIARNGSVINRYGNSISTTQTLLNTDEAASATVLGVVSTSGWAVSDQIAIASTSRTASQCEVRTILTVDSSTQVTVTAGLTNAHSGTSPTQAEVINITRNNKVCGTSSSLQAYVLYGTTAVVNDSFVEFYNLGSATTNKRGIDVLTTTGSCTITGCAVHDNGVASSQGVNITGSASNNVTLSNAAIWNVHTNAINVAVTTGTAIALSTSTALLNVSGALIQVADVGTLLTTLTAAGSAGNGFTITETFPSAAAAASSGLTAHSNASAGISFAGLQVQCTLSACTLWRNNGGGLLISSNTANVLFDTGTAFGNVSPNIGSAASSNIRFKSWTLNGDTTFSTGNGFVFSALGGPVFFDSCDFGTAAGIKVAHSTGDISTNSYAAPIVLRNTILASSTEIDSSTSMPAAPAAYVVSEKHDQTAGLHKRWERYGTATIDTTTFRTASPAETLTPSNASFKFNGSPMRFAIANATTATVTVYVNKSAAYNGAQPRLIVRANPAVGITADTVLATASGGTGSWLTLSGTTASVTDDGALEVYVDCDGTAGEVSIDDWDVTNSNLDAGAQQFWYDGQPFGFIKTASAGGASIKVHPGMAGGIRG